MINAFAYMGITTPNHADWNDFGTRILGLERGTDSPDGGQRYRLDDALFRLAVYPGDKDDVAYLGWTVNSAAEAEVMEQRLSKIKALAIFSSDALSSTAYATQEMLFILMSAVMFPRSHSYLVPIAVAAAASSPATMPISTAESGVKSVEDAIQFFMAGASALSRKTGSTAPVM